MANRDSDRALLVVDTTASARADVPSADTVLTHIRGELKYFRERGRMVLFAQRPGEEALLPARRNEPVIEKNAPSAFFGTGLDKLLRQAEVERLTIVGFDTPTNVLLTAGDALAHRFRVVVPEPCCAARVLGDHKAAMHLIQEVWAPGAELSRTGQWS